MNNRQLAGGIASLGRGPDSMLMHVTPREVQALGSMVPGGSLPTNPQTGLPEAGIFDMILPVAATIGGSMIGMPWLGAAASGANTYAKTGDLGAGIMAGIGSYGMGQVLGAAGDFGASDVAAQGASDVAAQGAAGAASGVGDAGLSFLDGGAFDPSASIGANAGNFGGQGLGAPSMSPSSAGSLSMSPSGMATPMPQAGGVSAGYELGNPMQQAFVDMSMGDQASAVGKGLTSGEFWGQQIKENPGTLAMAATGVGSHLANMAGPGGDTGGQKYKYTGLAKDKIPNLMPRNMVNPNAGYRPGFDAEHDYFRPIRLAEGGIVDGQMMAGAVGGIVPPEAPAQGGGQDREIFLGAVQAIKGESEDPEAAVGAFIKRFGPDEFEKLVINIKGGESANVGGDGRSDSIPATIEGEQPAQLSEGEFVVPSDVVADLGNGSSEAGSRQLEQMMERVRMAKGRQGSPPPITPTETMPA